MISITLHVNRQLHHKYVPLLDFPCQNVSSCLQTCLHIKVIPICEGGLGPILTRQVLFTRLTLPF